MWRFLIASLVLVAMNCAERGFAQQLYIGSSPPRVGEQIGKGVLYSPVAVITRSRGRLAGYLLGVNKDTLVVLCPGHREAVPLNDLARVTIDVEKNPSKFAGYGMLIAMYLGDVLFLRAENQPTAYLSEEHSGTWELGFYNALFVLLGGGVGYLVSGVEKGEEQFDFVGGEEECRGEWQRLNDAVKEKPRHKRIHLLAQAARVYPRVYPEYSTMMTRAGYYVYKGSYGYPFGSSAERATDFNLLRRLQLTVSLTPAIEIGAALTWSGEPSISGSQYQARSSYVEQSLDLRNYHAVATYEPLLAALPKEIHWDVGLAFGIARVDFSLKAQSTTFYPWPVYPSYETTTSEQKISKTLVSSAVFSELALYLHDGLSLGFIADYVYVPSQQAEAIPEAGIAAQKLRLENGSLGITLGLHF